VRKHSPILAACAILVCAPGAFAADAPYAWPLDLTPQLTSSFAEFRPGRFHAGIDIRTQGTGRNVHAAADGHVSRIRCSPWGYGKAVYIQLKDGNTAAYAHLEAFNDELNAYIRQAQHAEQSYTVDISPKAGRFPVRRGDVLARSGQTGIGAPHLHYELRGAAQDPINPYLLGVDWPDQTAPEIGAVLLAPLGEKATLNGDVMPLLLDVHSKSPGQYRCDPVRASGSFFAGAQISDPGDGGYRLGIHNLRFSTRPGENTPSEMYFQMRHDRLSYANHRNAAVAYHPFFLEEAAFLLGYRWPGNVCDSYGVSPGKGVLTMENQPFTLEVEARDFAGNTARVKIPILPDANPALQVSAEAHGGAAQVSVDCFGETVILTARFDAPEGVTPEFHAQSETDDVQRPMRRVDAKTFRAVLQPKASGHYRLQAMHPRIETAPEDIVMTLRGAGLFFEAKGLRITIPHQSPYGLLCTQVRIESKPPPSPLTQRGLAYRIWPENAPMDTPVEISFPLPEGSSTQLGVYRWKKDRWRREDTQERAGCLALSTRSFGLFALFEDRHAPTLSDILPREGYAAKTKRPLVHATVKDVGSGIESAEVYCGDEWMLAAYDPERSKLHWERDQDLPAGEQNIRFRLRDAAGNTTEITRTIRIP
jgi:hypothetical protein